MLVLFLVCILTFDVLAFYQSESKLMAHWPLDINDKSAFIKDNTGTYNLDQKASVEKGTWSGFSSSYLPSLDMRNTPWFFEGTFQTENEDESIGVIAGTRSALSGYTGWDFLMMKNGTLRVMAVDNEKKGVTLTSSSRSFADGKPHHFSLEWNPAGGNGTITLVIDKKYKYSTSGAGDLGENTKRLFGIGCQPGNSKALLWTGKLENFKFTGVPQASTSSSTETRIENLDAEMKTGKSADPTVKWINATDLSLEGKGWKDSETPYNRLPARFKSVVRSPVWALSTHSAGIYVRFTASNTSFINAKWKLKSNAYLPHMSPVGVNGLDLYVKLNGKWQWAGIAKPHRSDLENEVSVKGGIPVKGKYEYMLYLPLYTGVTDLQLGFSPNAQIERAQESVKKPIVFYGTSITHGCSASRPGMAYPSIIGRRLDFPVVNLGFSGNGTMDSEFGGILSEITASAYVIDCLPNMGSMSETEIKNRTLDLVKTIRSKHAETPIILMEDRSYTYANFTDQPVANHRRTGLKAAYEELQKNNINKLTYIEGKDLIGTDNEATVDGSHPTDLGLFRYAEILEPVLRKVLSI